MNLYDPISGAAILVTHSFFDNTRDDVLMWGFGAADDGTRRNPASPKFVEQLESNYRYDNRNWVEKNLDLETAKGDKRRFLYFQADRDNPDTYAQWTFSIAGGGQFRVVGPIDQSSPKLKPLFEVRPDGSIHIGGATLTENNGQLLLNGRKLVTI